MGIGVHLCCVIWQSLLLKVLRSSKTELCSGYLIFVHQMVMVKLNDRSYSCVDYRARKGYWENLKPSSGRPFCSSFSKSDNWGLTAGDKELEQHKESTTQEEMKAVIDHATRVVNGQA